MAKTNKFYQPVQGVYVNQYAPDVIDKDLAVHVATNVQNTYDTTLAAANQDFIDMQYINRGEMGELGRELEDEYMQDQQKLVDDLITTKDYGAAAKGIMSLRRKYAQDDRRKYLQKAHDGYKEQMKLVQSKVKSGQMISEYQRRTNEDLEKFKIRDRWGDFVDFQYGAYGDVTSTTQLMSSILPMLKERQEIITENGKRFMLTDISRDGAGQWSQAKVEVDANGNPVSGQPLATAISTAERLSVDENRIRGMFNKAMETDPVLYAERESFDYLYGAGTYAELATKAADMAEFLSTERVNFKDNIVENEGGGEGGGAAGPGAVDLFNTDGYVKSTSGSRNIVDSQKANENLSATAAALSLTPFSLNQEELNKITTSLGTEAKPVPKPVVQQDKSVSMIPDEVKFTGNDIDRMREAELKEGTDSPIADSMEQYNAEIAHQQVQILTHNANNTAYRKAERDIFQGQNFMPVEGQYEAYREIMDIKASNPQRAVELLEKHFKIDEDDSERVASVFGNLIHAQEMPGTFGQSFNFDESGLLKMGNSANKFLMNEGVKSEVMKMQNTEKFKIAEKIMAKNKTNVPTLEMLRKDDKYMMQQEDAEFVMKYYERPDFAQYMREERVKHNETVIHDIIDNGGTEVDMEAATDALNSHMATEFGQGLDKNISTFSYLNAEPDGKEEKAFFTESGARALQREEQVVADDFAGFDSKQGHNHALTILENANMIMTTEDGKDVTLAMFTEDGAASIMVEDSKTENGAVVSPLANVKFDYKGVTYLPDAGGAGFVVTMNHYDGEGSDAKFLYQQEIFIQHQQADKFYSQHLSLKQQNSTDGAQAIELELANLNEVIQKSVTNNIQGYPLGMYNGKNMKVDITPHERNPLVYRATLYYMDGNKKIPTESWPEVSLGQLAGQFAGARPYKED